MYTHSDEDSTYMMKKINENFINRHMPKMYVFSLIYWYMMILTMTILIKKVERDILAIGTPTTLLAYDVENNSDLFYKEVML